MDHDFVFGEEPEVREECRVCHRIVKALLNLPDGFGIRHKEHEGPITEDNPDIWEFFDEKSGKVLFHETEPIRFLEHYTWTIESTQEMVESLTPADKMEIMFTGSADGVIRRKLGLGEDAGEQEEAED